MAESPRVNVSHEAMGRGSATAFHRLWQVKMLRHFWLASTVSNLGRSAFLMAICWLTVRL